MEGRNKGNIVYIGMEETGFLCLEKLLGMGAYVEKVYTIDESLRDTVVGFKSFDSVRERFGVNITKVKDINDLSIISEIKRIKPRVIYIVSWSQLICKEILKVPPLGCVGFHASLLPKHRGRAPIPWSIIFGLRKSGLTLFYLTENSDDGDIIAQEEFDILFEDDAYSVYKKVQLCALRLIERYHHSIMKGTAPRVRQIERGFDYWPKRMPQDGYIDWNKSASHIYDWIRALTYPFPGAFTYYGDRKLFIWKSSIFSHKAEFESGKIYKDLSAKGMVVGAAQGSIVIQEAQFDGEESLKGPGLLKKIGEDLYFT